MRCVLCAVEVTSLAEESCVVLRFAVLGTAGA